MLIEMIKVNINTYDGFIIDDLNKEVLDFLNESFSGLPEAVSFS